MEMSVLWPNEACSMDAGLCKELIRYTGQFEMMLVDEVAIDVTSVKIHQVAPYGDRYQLDESAAPRIAHLR